MPTNIDDGDTVPWVDIFSQQTFGGRLTRLFGGSGRKIRVYKGKKLPAIKSIIVGPGTIVEVITADDARSIRLSQKTVLADISHLIDGQTIQGVRVIPAMKRRDLK